MPRIVKTIVLFIGMVLSMPMMGESTAIDTIVHRPDYYSMPLGATVSEYLAIRPSSELAKDKYIGKAYWSSFKLQNKLGYQFLEVSVPMSDEAYLYRDTEDGPELIDSMGIIKAPRPLSCIRVKSRCIIDIKNIDDGTTFHIKNVPSSTNGYLSIRRNYVLYYHKEFPTYFLPEYQKANLERDDFRFVLFNLIGMIAILSIIIFIQYIFTGKIHFLWYSLYLFALVFNYGHRTFYMGNFLSQFHDHAYMYFDRNWQVIANIFYMLFVRDFVQIKKYFPRLYPFYQGMFYFFIVFLVVYDILIFVNPYFMYHELIMIVFIYMTAAASIGFVAYMFYHRKEAYTAIVFFGSVLLILGYVGAIYFENFFILVPLIVVEGLMIVGLLGYLDLQYYKKAMERDKYHQLNDMKNQFLANIAHEIRTPLSIMSANLDLIKNNDKERLNIKKNLSKTQKFVDDLIVLSKLETGEMPIEKDYGDIVKHIERVVLNMESLADSKNIVIHFQPGIEKALICYDKSKIEMILENLINNAIKYSYTNSEIIVSLGYNRQLLTLSVSDNGIGIEDKRKPKVFQKYYQTSKKHTNGFGVGLALVKEIITLLNGTITITDNEPQGTTFEVLIPALEANYNEESFISNTIYVDPSAATLVLVDDDRDFLEFMNDLLGELYKVYTTAYSSLALELIELKKPDIIIVDYHMPEINGDELIKMIKSDNRLAHIPVICMSSYTESKFKNHMLAAGALSVLEKPFNYSILINTINNILNRDKLQIGHEVISPDEDSWIEKVHQLIYEYGNRLSIQDLAEKLYMSRSQLHRKIKGEYQMSSSEFIKHLVIKRAKSLLEGGLAVSKVADILGYKNTSQFSVDFKKITGKTPSRW